MKLIKNKHKEVAVILASLFCFLLLLAVVLLKIFVIQDIATPTDTYRSMRLSIMDNDRHKLMSICTKNGYQEVLSLAGADGDLRILLKSFKPGHLPDPKFYQYKCTIIMDTNVSTPWVLKFKRTLQGWKLDSVSTRILDI